MSEDIKPGARCILTNRVTGTRLPGTVEEEVEGGYATVIFRLDSGLRVGVKKALLTLEETQ